MEFSREQLDSIIKIQSRRIDILESWIIDEGVYPETLYEQYRAYLNFEKDSL